MILLDPELEPEPTRRARGLSTRSLARFLTEAQAAVRLQGQVAVLLSTDTALRDLNRRFRGKDSATDVLSFRASAPASAPEGIAGDIAISVETARRHAAEQGHSLPAELTILILHGLLHLAGYDHESDVGQMRRRERALRAQLGLPQGLIERANNDPLPEGAEESGPGQVRRGGRGPGTGSKTNRKAPEGRKNSSRTTARSSRREATRIAQGAVRRSERNPGKARRLHSRRPGGPARDSMHPARDTRP